MTRSTHFAVKHNPEAAQLYSFPDNIINVFLHELLDLAKFERMWHYIEGVKALTKMQTKWGGKRLYQKLYDEKRIREFDPN